MYKLLRSVLFLFPPESVHHFSMDVLKFLCQLGRLRRLFVNFFTPRGTDLGAEVFGLHFRNRVGLGAGFDKNALYLSALDALGFGFVEIGTVTPKAQTGNDKPRLFRLPKDKALINRMGFNNDGVQVIAERLRKWRATEQQTINSSLIIGGNIGKNKTTPNDEAWKDYETCFLQLYDCVDYFVVNVSSPNTPGLRELQEKESLRKILTHLQELNQRNGSPKPLLLKIAPDLSQEQIDDVIDLAMEINLDGLVATNTTITRDALITATDKINAIGAGGLSGKPLARRAFEISSYIHERSAGKLACIASGGIFTAADMEHRLQAGASLVQVWTGFIYEGPGIVTKLLSRKRVAKV